MEVNVLRLLSFSLISVVGSMAFIPSFEEKVRHKII